MPMLIRYSYICTSFFYNIEHAERTGQIHTQTVDNSR